MRINYRIKKIFAYISLFSIVVLIINNAVFTHFHILENGTIISHAHPFDKFAENSNKKPQHTHSEKEYVFYKILSSVLNYILIVFALSLFAFIYFFKERLYSLSFSLSIQSTIEAFKARPPPVLFNNNF